MRLSSGRTVERRGSGYGISDDGEVTEAWDTRSPFEGVGDGGEFTAEEREAYALIMISRWARWGGLDKHERYFEALKYTVEDGIKAQNDGK